jgi:ketosteroid isomerase-like protein
MLVVGRVGLLLGSESERRIRMSAEENAALLRRYLEALSQGDMDTVREAFAEDAVWHLPGKSPLAGNHKGPDAILEFIGRAFEMTGAPSDWSCST